MLLVASSLLISLAIYEMDEVVVTANRYPVLLQDIAVAVMVLEREDIEKLHPLGLGEILNAASGIDFKDYGTPGGVTSMSVRGISSNGTLVLVNGHPLNTVTHGMADLSSIDINSIERIEIVKGPVSSIYGANALGGLINIITFRELNKPQIELKLTPSTTSMDEPFETKDISVRLGLPACATQFDINGAYSGSAGQRSNSDMDRYNIGGSFRHNTERYILGSSLLYTEKEYGIPGPLPFVDSLHPPPQFGDSTATSVSDRERDRTLLANLNAELRITDNVTWYGKILADRKQTIFWTTYAGWPGDTISEQYDYLTHAVGMSMMMTARGENIDVIVGIDTRYDTLQTRMNSTATGETLWHASSYDAGIWTELRSRLNDAISVAPSIRYDHNSTFGAFLSPGIGIVSVLSQFVTMKLSAGKTFRAPSFNDLYWPQSGNPELRPEHGWAYEVRVESSPMPSLFSSVSLFMRNIRDRIAWLPLESGLWQPQNLNHLSVKGLDIELKHSLNEFIQYTLDFTYLNARQRNDEIIYSYYDWMADTGLTITAETERAAAFTPEYSISSAVDVELPRDFGFNISGQYVSARVNYYANYDDYPAVSMDTKRLGAYLVINAALTKRIFKQIILTGGIKNVLDTDYAMQFGNTIADLDYPMPARTYFVRLAVKY
jgi:vitamin B12 transporter